MMTKIQICLGLYCVPVIGVLLLAPLAPARAGDDGQRKIVFLAGAKSHGYNAHEHYAGCMLLAKCLDENVPDTETLVVKEGWPNDPTVLGDARAIVVISDGGGSQPLMGHLDELKQNQDYPEPADFNWARIQKQIDAWNR